MGVFCAGFFAVYNNGMFLWRFAVIILRMVTKLLRKCSAMKKFEIYIISRVFFLVSTAINLPQYLSTSNVQEEEREREITLELCVMLHNGMVSGVSQRNDMII